MVIALFVAFSIIGIVAFSGIMNGSSYKIKTAEGDTILIKIQNNIPMRSNKEHRVEISAKGFEGSEVWIFEGTEIKKGDENVRLVSSGKDYRKYNISFKNYSHSIIVYLDINRMQLSLE